MKRNIKIVLLITLSMLLLTSCGKSEQDKAKEMISSGEGLELKLNSYNTGNVIDEPTAEITWEVLAHSNTFKTKGFRSSFDKTFNINRVTVVEDGNIVDSKQGCIYTKSNGGIENQSSTTTMRDAFRNKQFNKYLESDKTIKDIGEYIDKAYTDVDKTSLLIKNASLNAYFNISSLVDNEIYYNAEQVLTRDQFCSAVYRAGFPTNEFVDSINFNDYTKLLNDYLLVEYNEDLYKQPITKLEAYYIVTKLYFQDYIDIVDFDDKTTGFGFKNAKDLANQLGINTNDYQLLAYMSNFQSDGIDANILKVITTAERLGFGSGVGTDLFGVITKDQTIKLLTNVYSAENNIRGYLTESEYAKMEIPVYTYYDETEDLDFKEPLVLSEDKVKFVGDQSVYVDEERAIEVLTPLADYMVKYDKFKLLLIGTTAGDNNSDRTIKLSEDRANTVKNTLVDMGANPDNIVVIGLGCDDPWHISGAGTQGEDAAKNRKVVMLNAESEDGLKLQGIEVEDTQLDNTSIDK